MTKGPLSIDVSKNGVCTKINIVPEITDDESRALTLLYLTGTPVDLYHDTYINLKRKGIIKGLPSGGYEATEYAMDAISIYPAFGSGEKSRPFLHDLIPALFSLTLSEELPSRQSSWKRVLSSPYFTSIFPSRDPNEIASIAKLVMHALIDLEIVKQNDEHLTLQCKKAISFYSLKEEEKLAYLIAPGSNEAKIERLSKSIALIMNIRSLPFSELLRYVLSSKRIIAQEGNPVFTINELDMLFDLGALYKVDNECDELVYAEEIESDDETGVFSSDFSYTFKGRTQCPIFMFLHPEKSDIHSQWRITRKSIKSAFSMGYTPDDIEKEFLSITNSSIPESIIDRIKLWYEEFQSIKAERAIILKADEKNARIIEALPAIQGYILQRLSNGVFIMDPSAEWQWRRILSESGLDMLGLTTGPEFKQNEDEVLFRSFDGLKRIERLRKRPYKEEQINLLLSRAKSPIERAYLKSGIVLDDGYEPVLEKAYGLDYQEKLRIAQEAIKNGCFIYYEYPDGENGIEKGIEILESDGRRYISTNSGISICLDRLWLIIAMPEYITNR